MPDINFINVDKACARALFRSFIYWIIIILYNIFYSVDEPGKYFIGYNAIRFLILALRKQNYPKLEEGICIKFQSFNVTNKSKSFLASTPDPTPSTSLYSCKCKLIWRDLKCKHIYIALLILMVLETTYQ